MWKIVPFLTLKKHIQFNVTFDIFFFICINFDLFSITECLFLYLLHFIVTEALIGRLFWYNISSTCASCCCHTHTTTNVSMCGSMFPSYQSVFSPKHPFHSHSDMCTRVWCLYYRKFMFSLHSNNKRSMIWHHNAMRHTQTETKTKSLWKRRSDSFKAIN